MVQIGLNLGIFKLFTEAAGPLKVDEVAKKTSSDRQLMRNTPFSPSSTRHISLTPSQADYSDTTRPPTSSPKCPLQHSHPQT